MGRGQASEAEKARYVRRMFGAIAPRYDLLNTLLSGGLHRRWKRFAAAQAHVPQGGRALDVCCGTGDLALLLAGRAGPRGNVVGVDIAEEMLRVARRKAHTAGLAGRVRFALGDAEALGLPDGAFDAATVAFGVRNTIHPQAALLEIRRVLRPGGRLVVLEFSRPYNAAWGWLYSWYSFTLVPRVGRLVSRHADAYLYLPTSIRAWPDQEGFAAMMIGAGFGEVRYHSLLGGVAAVHVGVRPAALR
ncbi:MAG TPA: bifunctional demethylmenaquinone methyltransferase/2-methoxy-6-polyprenyl-1,4-benzoquinol methylase UbiE [bacterium]|nr:bifunctional demethylmenaquinone methyltransferase/2-methoxy-6-polyprenyl-1,4-benzoquinol methylase UbiE [bacterium]